MSPKTDSVAAERMASSESFVTTMTVVSGANGKSKLAGRLGEGGPVLTFHANGGHVKLTPSASFIEEGPPDPAGELRGASDLRRSKK